MHDQLQQAIAAAEVGQRTEARQLLLQVVEDDERNEDAWLRLASVLDHPEDRRMCLENVLELNPQHSAARAAVAQLNVPVARQPGGSPPAGSALDEPKRLLEAVAPPASSDPARTGGVAHAVPVATHAPASGPSPCPYCGVPTAASQAVCLRCGKSLMLRVAPRHTRSIELILLAILSGIGSVLAIVTGALLMFAGFLFVRANGQPQAQPALLAQELQQIPAASSFPAGLDATELLNLLGSIIYTLALAVLFGGLVSLGVTVGLWQRQRWAYLVAIAFSVLGALSAALSVVLAVVTQHISLSTISGVVLQAIMTMLTIACSSDFFGPKVRFLPKAELTHAAGHYTNGLAYKQRGMWYLVAQEWEAAVRQAPSNLQYLHALGLAYGQLKQFDRARATLDQALRLAPDDGALAESRALLERMANGQRA